MCAFVQWCFITRSFSQTVRDGMTVGQERLQKMSMVGHDSTEKSIVSFISKYVATRNLLCHVSRSARNYCVPYFGFREEWVPISMRSEMISNTTEQLHSPRSDKEKKNRQTKNCIQ